MSVYTWMHCNFCACRPQKNLAFHLTSCGHVVCNECVVSRDLGVKFQCSQCGGKSASRVQIDRNMRRDAQDFFLPMPDLVDRWLQEAVVVDKFQKNNRTRVMRRRAQQDKAMAKMQELWQIEMKKKAETKKQMNAMHAAMLKLNEDNRVIRAKYQALASASKNSAVSPQSLSTNYRLPPSVTPAACNTPMRPLMQNTSNTTTSSYGGASSDVTFNTTTMSSLGHQLAASLQTKTPTRHDDSLENTIPDTTHIARPTPQKHNSRKREDPYQHLMQRNAMTMPAKKFHHGSGGNSISM